ncbi:hypothetical protein FALBO_606 [Fusarium albosuccineum]|uniref:Uncharacterized protein n=1 Tax=Fusarium albosuccineum TaxID=1237068 RepID=A0A8H4LNE2_9HYPO|nr:hypothetical protein FALBO_606 [Fusarium albosuccineum]
MSSSDRMLEKPRDFLASSSPPPPRFQARFAHICLPPHSPDDWDLSKEIHRSVSSFQDQPRLHFVVPETEMEMMRRTKVQFDQGPSPPVIWSYVEFFNSLKSHRRPGVGRMGWEPLNENTVIMFLIDPTFPADCALALTALVQWAMNVHTLTTLRVITASIDSNYDVVQRLVKLQDPHVTVNQVDLASLSDQDHIRNADICEASNEQAIAQEIFEFAKANPDHPQTIISFHTGNLQGALEELIREAGMPEMNVTAVSTAKCVPALMNFVRQTDGFRPFRFLEVYPAFPFTPMALAGNTDVHIVLGSWCVSSSIWNNKIGQNAISQIKTSREQRIAQMCWARQPHALQTRIYLEGDNLTSFMATHHARRRLIEGQQLGGFIASVVDISSWGIDTIPTIRCMVRDARLIAEQMHRLRVQRVICDEGLALSTSEANAFRAALPVVQFDHRRALFVALDATPRVRLVKVQLAVLMTAGVHGTWSISPSAGEDADLREQIFDCCWGYGRRMARQGAMWLALGLWKHLIRSQDDPDGRLLRYNAVNRLVSIERNDMRRLKQQLEDLLTALREQNIPLPLDTSVRDEIEDVNAQEQIQLQSHLLRAFISQLVGSYTVSSAGDASRPQLVHTFLSTQTQVNVIGAFDTPGEFITLHDLIQEEEGGDLVLGVCDELVITADGRLLAIDWTQIPKHVVNQWKQLYSPHMTVTQALKSGIQRSNVDPDEYRGH